jgi:copper homeostasis protein
VAEVGGTVEVMAGGGVGVDDIASLAAVGVDAVHLSARRRASQGGPSGPGGGIEGFDETDPAIVAAAVAAAAGTVRRHSSPKPHVDR